MNLASSDIRSVLTRSVMTPGDSRRLGSRGATERLAMRHESVQLLA
jgi:hypothetical protein